MHRSLRTLFMIISSALAASVAQAQSGTLEVTASYRERIALPPDAQLFVQLIDVSLADAPAVPIAAQRFAMSGVPMTVSLTYDPAVIENGRRYAVRAGLWSGDTQIFTTMRSYTALDDATGEPVEIILSMVEHADDAALPPRTITGVRWVVTEVLGTPWNNDDPATLVIDDAMSFSLFGGCNRFTGEVQMSVAQVTFPENFAGTLMACPDDVETLERDFLHALSLVSSYVRYGAGLVMTDATGNAVLHFEDRPE